MAQQESLLGPYLQPGTKVKVGQYSTKILRYLSEGGFSHVYIARLDIPVKGSDVAVLKRIVAPDKVSLAAIRTEVDTMKRLKGHRYIVTYIDSHASALSVGFEVYVLMEYCPGGGLIDFMNTRLQTRLAEWEVLKIISDTAEAVACMHYLRPPLLHRDLKIENVLISGDGCYKLCDFGSCTAPRPAATNALERRQLEDDIQKNTTIQYRSPEMVDVTRGQAIDEKSDIWALGVLLYKLCYFTTPFETQGQLAILNAAYTFPPFPPYTDRTKRLIAVTLQENPKDRPNIYQLVAEICSMRNKPVPIPDIYSKSRSTTRARSHEAKTEAKPHEADLLSYEIDEPERTVTHASGSPMRRGRPSKAASPVRTLPSLEPQSKPELEPRSVPETLVDPKEFQTKFPSLEELNVTLSAHDRPYVFAHDDGVERKKNHDNSNTSLLNQTPDTADATKTVPKTFAAPEQVEHDRSMKPSEVAKSGMFMHQSRSEPQKSHETPPADAQFDTSSRKGLPSIQAPQVRKEFPMNKNPYLAQGAVSKRPDELKDSTRRNIATVQDALQASSKLLPESRITKDHDTMIHSTFQATSEPVSRADRRSTVLEKRKTIQLDYRTIQEKHSSDPALSAANPVLPASQSKQLEPRRPNTSSSTIDIRRSASVSSSGKHGKRPSLNSVPSFSGTARNIMSGKFSEAFRKFENNKKTATSPENREPLQVQENDLPDHVKEHIKTSDARRSLSYSRSRQSLEETRRVSSEPNEATPRTSVKEAMRLLKEKANAPFNAPRSAQGYGKYTEPADMERATTVIPDMRPEPLEKPNVLKTGRQTHAITNTRNEEDDDFSKRYPSLSEFTV